MKDIRGPRLTAVNNIDHVGSGTHQEKISFALRYFMFAGKFLKVRVI